MSGRPRIRERLAAMLNLPQFGIPAEAAEAHIEYLAAVLVDRDTGDAISCELPA